MGRIVSSQEIEWQQIEVTAAGLSPRTVRALRDPGDAWVPLRTMGEVVRFTDRELLSRPGLGPAALAEIDNWFTERLVGRPRETKRR